MICRIEIPFESSKRLNYSFYASSVMQGIIMENISGNYAEEMHKQALRPYSQFSACRSGQNIWTISVLSREAYDNIVIPILSMKQAEVRHNNDIITFGKPAVEIMTYQQLLCENSVNSAKSDAVELDFTTPTAFKSSGKYVILPTLRLIFSSLAKRFDTFFGISNNNYEALADEIEENVTISDYKLSSSSFSLEGVRLPSFRGSLKIRIKGSGDFRSYIRMLCRFAEFSGVGIKTAIGMGQIRIKFLLKSGTSSL